jgi:hypothetical protein
MAWVVGAVAVVSGAGLGVFSGCVFTWVPGPGLVLVQAGRETAADKTIKTDIFLRI